jgi:F-type H+-transporting ATPase subunit b
LELYTGLIEFNWTLLINMASMIVLFLIMRKKFFHKIRNHMLKRQEAVANSIANAERKNVEAELLLADYKKKLAEVDEEARERIRQAVVKAEAHAKDILAEAQKKSVELLKKTDIEIEREKHQAIGDLKNQIAELAIFAAQKVIEKELDAKEHHEMIGRIIDEAGTVKWQN